MRVAFAGALTVGLLTALAGFGGLGAAVAAPAKAVKAVVDAVDDDGVQVIQQTPSCDQYVMPNSGRGNLSETESGTGQTDSDTLINPHLGDTALGPGDFPTDDCDPGSSGPQNRGGD